MLMTPTIREEILSHACATIEKYGDGKEYIYAVREAFGNLLDGCSVTPGNGIDDDYTYHLVKNWIVFDKEIVTCGCGGSTAEMYANAALNACDKYVLRVADPTIKNELVRRILSGNAVDEQRIFLELRNARIIN